MVAENAKKRENLLSLNGSITAEVMANESAENNTYVRREAGAVAQDFELRSVDIEPCNFAIKPN